MFNLTFAKCQAAASAGGSAGPWSSHTLAGWRALHRNLATFSTNKLSQAHSSTLNATEYIIYLLKMLPMGSYKLILTLPSKKRSNKQFLHPKQEWWLG